jgi:hypothetical protein
LPFFSKVSHVSDSRSRSLVLLATALAAKRRPAELLEIMAAIDLIQGNIPNEAKAERSLRAWASPACWSSVTMAWP